MKCTCFFIFYIIDDDGIDHVLPHSVESDMENVGDSVNSAWNWVCSKYYNPNLISYTLTVIPVNRYNG